MRGGSPWGRPEYAGIYLHARYFDPKLGQFLSPDPIGPAGGLNSFAYGFGDPVNLADASGLTPNFVFCQPQPYCRWADPNSPSPSNGSIGIPIVDWLFDFFFGSRYDPNPGTWPKDPPRVQSSLGPPVVEARCHGIPRPRRRRRIPRP